jgi:hypothetical protein
VTDSGFEELLQTSDLGELQLVKGLLDAAEIPFTVDGEGSLQTLPVRTPGFFRGRGLAAVIRVRAEDLDEARALLAGEAPGWQDSEGEAS